MSNRLIFLLVFALSSCSGGGGASSSSSGKSSKGGSTNQFNNQDVDNTEQGTWDLTQAFPGPGLYSAVSNTPTNGNQFCQGLSLFGISGLAICQSGSATTPASAANVLSGMQYWDSTGALVTGAMSNHGQLNAENSFPGAGYYSGVTNLPSANEMCNGTKILGVNGSVDCSGAYTSTPNYSSYADLMESIVSQELTNNSVWTLGSGDKMLAGTVINNAPVPDPISAGMLSFKNLSSHATWGYQITGADGAISEPSGRWIGNSGWWRKWSL